MTRMLWYLACVYVVSGAFLALKWLPLLDREFYAIFGPTNAGRVCGIAVAAALVVVLWPIYLRLRFVTAARLRRG